MGRQKRPLLLENVVYRAIIDKCSNKKITGITGEKLAYLLAKDISVAMLTKPQQKVYQALGKLQAKHPDGVFTADIARLAKMDVTPVSAHLTYLFNRTLLLECQYEGRNRLWKQA